MAFREIPSKVNWIMGINNEGQGTAKQVVAEYRSFWRWKKNTFAFLKTFKIIKVVLQDFRWIYFV